MKLWIIAITSIIIFSGCNSRTQTIQLQNKNAKQALIIQQQQAQIDALNKKMTKKKRVRVKRQRTTKVPTPPKKNIKLKKVEDNNYSSGYMYPGQAKKKPQKPVKLAKAMPVATPSSSSMGKSECVAMIGADKFAKYTQMFGSEAASIKRCKMLKAMKQ
jgi:hypothetical protein